MAIESVLDPDHYLEKLDLDKGIMEFTKINVDEFRNASFMDKRLKTMEGVRLTIKLSDAEQLIKNRVPSVENRTINYIFHTAFCCSTLIAKCLDIRNKSITLREPAVLMQLANYKRTGHPSMDGRKEFISLLELTSYCLSFAGNRNEYVAIKPTNSANNLADEILDCGNTGHVLLLYSSLERFLVSIIKGGEERRAFVRRLFNLMRNDSERIHSIPPAMLTQLTDLQMAALVWNLHMDHYLHMLEKHAAKNIKTLDCDTFLDMPAQTLTKLLQYFNYEIGQQTTDAILAGPVLNTYSKQGDLQYNHQVRDQEYTEVLRQHQGEISLITAWSEHIRPDGALKLPLPNAL